MRSAEDLRNRWIDLIPSLLSRTSMFATTGREIQLFGDRLSATLTRWSGTCAALAASSRTG